jgi:hypothetical protein
MTERLQSARQKLMAHRGCMLRCRFIAPAAKGRLEFHRRDQFAVFQQEANTTHDRLTLWLMFEKDSRNSGATRLYPYPSKGTDNLYRLVFHPDQFPLIAYSWLSHLSHILSSIRRSPPRPQHPAGAVSGAMGLRYGFTPIRRGVCSSRLCSSGRYDAART